MQFKTGWSTQEQRSKFVRENVAQPTFQPAANLLDCLQPGRGLCVLELENGGLPQAQQTPKCFVGHLAAALL